MRANWLKILAAMALAGWLILPFLPLLIWSVAHGWRFPDLLPQAFSTISLLSPKEISPKPLPGRSWEDWGISTSGGQSSTTAVF